MYRVVGQNVDKSLKLRTATASERGTTIVDDIMRLHYDFTTLDEFINDSKEYVEHWVQDGSAVPASYRDAKHEERSRPMWYLFGKAVNTYKNVALTASALQRIIEMYTSLTLVFELDEERKVQVRQTVDDATIRETVRKNLAKVGVTLPAEGGRRKARMRNGNDNGSGHTLGRAPEKRKNKA